MGPPEWAHQRWDMAFFDNVIHNIDRNAGNELVTSAYRLWLIDHTRGFQFKFELLDDAVVRVPERSWKLYLDLTESDLTETLGDFLTAIEIGAILRRRKVLIEHIDALIAERAEDGVFY